MIDKTNLSELERDLVEGLEGFLDDLKAGEVVPAKYTCRQVVLDLEPKSLSPEAVKATRQMLQVSQVLFAKFLGVSPQTVRSWEQGKSEPSDIASRFMDEIQRNPQYYRQRFVDAIRLRKCEA